MLFHTSLGPLFTRSIFSISLGISLCTESNLEQGAESSLEYIEMQRDCIIGWKDNSKLDDPNTDSWWFFVFFSGLSDSRSHWHAKYDTSYNFYQSRHFFLEKQKTNWQQVFKKFFILFSKITLIQRVIRRGRKKSHCTHYELRCNIPQKHPAMSLPIVCRIHISPFPPIPP